jgi:hypothetical protein
VYPAPKSLKNSVEITGIGDNTPVKQFTRLWIKHHLISGKLSSDSFVDEFFHVFAIISALLAVRSLKNFDDFEA